MGDGRWEKSPPLLKERLRQRRGDRAAGSIGVGKSPPFPFPLRDLRENNIPDICGFSLCLRQAIANDFAWASEGPREAET